jgi:HSP20 family molecular chaperone IbpA
MASEVAAVTKQEHESGEQTRAGRTYVPDVDITESGEALRVWADLPGVDENSVEVRLDQGLLSIEGRVSLEGYEDLRPVYTEYNVGNFVRRFRIRPVYTEYNVGNFVRRFRIPNTVDTAKIQGKMSNGVLELTIPKSEAARPRRIEVLPA